MTQMFIFQVSIAELKMYSDLYQSNLLKQLIFKKSAGLDRLESLMVPRSASGLFNEQEYLEDSSSESEESQLSSSCVSNKDDD